MPIFLVQDLAMEVKYSSLTILFSYKFGFYGGRKRQGVDQDVFGRWGALLEEDQFDLNRRKEIWGEILASRVFQA
jgi:hypothetical protein